MKPDEFKVGQVIEEGGIRGTITEIKPDGNYFRVITNPDVSRSGTGFQLGSYRAEECRLIHDLTSSDSNYKIVEVQKVIK